MYIPILLLFLITLIYCTNNGNIKIQRGGGFSDFIDKLKNNPKKTILFSVIFIVIIILIIYFIFFDDASTTKKLSPEPSSEPSPEPSKCSDNLCLNGGVCRDIDKNNYTCICSSEYSGTNCENIVDSNGINITVFKEGKGRRRRRRRRRRRKEPPTPMPTPTPTPTPTPPALICQLKPGQPEVYRTACNAAADEPACLELSATCVWSPPPPSPPPSPPPPGPPPGPTPADNCKGRTQFDGNCYQKNDETSCEKIYQKSDKLLCDWNSFTGCVPTDEQC